MLTSKLLILVTVWAVPFLERRHCLPLRHPAVLWEIDEQFQPPYNQAVELFRQVGDIMNPFEPNKTVSSSRGVTSFGNEDFSNIPPFFEMIPEFFLCDIFSEARKVEGCDILVVSPVSHQIRKLRPSPVSDIGPSGNLSEARSVSPCSPISQTVSPPPSVSLSTLSFSTSLSLSAFHLSLMI